MHRSKVHKDRRKKKEVQQRHQANQRKKTELLEKERHALGEFLNESSLAHDIRNLNKDLKYFSEQIEYVLSKHRNVIPREGEEYVFSLSALSEMVSHRLDVYDFFKNKSSISTSESWCCLHRVITRVVKVLEMRRKKNRITRINISPSTTEIRCSDKFHSALFAIVENCIKYSPENREINISIEETPETVKLQFNNFGPEIYDDELDLVFRAGERGRSADKHYPSKGNGIGMYYVKEMCNLHFFDVCIYQDKSVNCYQGGVRFYQTYTEVLVPKNI